MNKIERSVGQRKIIGGVCIIFAPLEAKKVRAWLTGKVKLPMIFINETLDRRQRGGEIRRGIKFHRKREASK